MTFYGSIDSAIALGGNQGPSVRPSLLLDFANTKQLDPRITFTRGSTATYYDGKTTAKAEENLLTYSQGAMTSGYNANSTGITATINNAVAPDGTTTAMLIQSSLTGSQIQRGVFRSTTVPVTSGSTFSVYVKAGNAGWVALSHEGGQDGWAFFDLVNGVVGSSSGCTPSIVYAGNGWYRCIIANCSFSRSSYALITIKNKNDTSEPWVNNQTYNGNESIYVWGAQLEQRAYATAYTPTTGSAITNYIPVLQTAASGTARFDHDPITGESKGLLIEESRTNLSRYNGAYSRSNWWNQYYCEIHDNAGIAPDGTLTASIFKALSGGSSLFQSAEGIATIGTAYTVSFWIKRRSGTGQVYIRSVENINTPITITNEWVRYSYTATATSTTLRIGLGLATPGDEIYFWGAQAEAGSFSTSYIPTTVAYTGRASTATYQSTDGTIRIAQPNVARYEPNAAGGSNLLLESSISNYFLMTNYLYGIGPGTGYGPKTRFFGLITSPSGALDGIALSGDGTGGNIYISHSYQITLAANTTYTVSCWAKLISGAVPTAGTIISAEYHNGTSVTRANVVYNGSGLNSSWKRFSVTFTNVTATGGIGTFFVADSNNTAVIGLWGCQVEAGSTATSYIPSTDTHTGRSSTATYYDSTGVIRTAASSQPRYTYNPSLLTAAPTLLLEPQATNQISYSSSISLQWAVNGGLTLSENAVVAPDGTQTADTLTEVINTGYHYMYTSVSLTAGTWYTFSTYVKPITKTSFAAYCADGSGGSPQIFWYTDTKTVSMYLGGSSQGYGSVTDVGNGWYRLSFSLLCISSISTALHFFFETSSQYTPSSAKAASFWGFQFEAGYAATSYIPTSGTAVTRAADTATSSAGSRAADVYSSSQITRATDTAAITGTNFSSWYRPAEGTLYGVGYSNSTTGFRRLVALTDANAQVNTVQLVYNNAAQSTIANMFVNAVQQAIGAGGTVSSPMAMAYKRNNTNTAISGVVGTANTACEIPVVDRLTIGGDGSGGSASAISGTIKRIAYYPKRLSDTELQNITTQ